MNYTLKSKNGKVTFLLKTNADFCRNEMSLAGAEHIINTGNVTKSEREDFPICVDDKWYFEGEVIEEQPHTEEKRGKSSKKQEE